MSLGAGNDLVVLLEAKLKFIVWQRLKIPYETAIYNTLTLNICKLLPDSHSCQLSENKIRDTIAKQQPHPRPHPLNC